MIRIGQLSSTFLEPIKSYSDQNILLIEFNNKKYNVFGRILHFFNITQQIIYSIELIDYTVNFFQYNINDSWFKIGELIGDDKKSFILNCFFELNLYNMFNNSFQFCDYENCTDCRKFRNLFQIIDKNYNMKLQDLVTNKETKQKTKNIPCCKQKHK